MQAITRTFVYALILTGLTTALSAAIASWGLHNLYYLAQLLPLFMAFYALLAWLLHLRRDSFLASDQPTRGAPPVLGHHEDEFSKDLPESKVAGAELLTQGHRIIPRRDLPKRDGPDQFLEHSIYTLFWSAGLLAILAFVFYRYLGIGTKYFLR